MVLKREYVRERRCLSDWLWIGMGARSEEPNGSCLPCTSHLMSLASVVVNRPFRADDLGQRWGKSISHPSRSPYESHRSVYRSEQLL